MMAAILDLGPKRDFAMCVLGELFLLWYTSNEFVSDSFVNIFVL